MKRLAWVLLAVSLAGCEFEIPGQKAKDAAAMGYACRVSVKSPEQCMRENPKYNPTPLLEGWHEADKDVKDKKVDTNFPPPPPVILQPETPPKKKAEGEGAEGEAKPEGEPAAAAEPAKAPEPEAKVKAPEAKPAEAKPAEVAKPAETKAESARAAKGH
ncbi:MAG: hypothetical protein KGZ83_09885 [Sulfuricella sp.]|nr:hypothetical protein [Sulfuricella sp.]